MKIKSIRIYYILFLSIVISCSKEESKIHENLDNQENVDTQDQNDVENNDQESNDDSPSEDIGDSPQILDGLTLSENAIDVTDFEFKIDTIQSTGELQIKTANGTITNGKIQLQKFANSATSKNIEIKIGSILMDNVRGFLVEVAEIREEVLIVVDASLDQFFFSGLTSILQTDLSGNNEVNTTELDLSFGFNKTFNPNPGFSVSFNGGMQWKPIFKTEIDYDKKKIAFSLNPQTGNNSEPLHPGDQALHLRGGFDLSMTSSVSEEIEFKLGSVERTFLAGPVFTTVRASLLYRPNVFSSVTYKDSRSLEFDIYPEFHFSYDDGGLQVDRNDVSFSMDKSGMFPKYETDMNFSIGHNLILKLEVLFFRKVGVFVEGGLGRQTTYRSNGTDWDMEQSWKYSAKLGVTQKLFKNIGEEAPIYEEDDTSNSFGRHIRIPGRIYYLDKLDVTKESQVIRFIVYPDDFSNGVSYLEPTLENLDYDKPIPNVKIYFSNTAYIDDCETPVTFNGLSSAMVETNSQGVAEVLIKAGRKASHSCNELYDDVRTFESRYIGNPKLFVKNGINDTIVKYRITSLD